MDHTLLTPLGLFLGAGPVVKGIVLLLVAASIWTWVVIIEGIVVIGRLKRAIRDAERSGSMAQTRLAAIETAGLESQHQGRLENGIAFARADIDTAMRHRAAELVESAEGGLPTLAIIASTAPFVGLLGTVWGIMTSFIGIAAMKDTSLAVVAPGIAEALAATAIGLAAAIPAAVGYNRVGAALARCGRRLGRLIEARATILAREINAGAQEPFRRAAE